MEASDFSVDKKYCATLGRNVIVKTDKSGKQECFDNENCEHLCEKNNESPD